MAKYAICPDDALIEHLGGGAWTIASCSYSDGTAAWQYVDVPTYAIDKDYYDALLPFVMWALVFAFGVKLCRKILGV